jgi:hypothetical protein
MKPTLRTIARAFGVTVPRSGDIASSEGLLRLYCFTGATWKRRSVQSVRIWSTHGVLPLPQVARAARELAVLLSYPVTFEAGRILATVDPSGHCSRVKSGPRLPCNPLP